MGEKMLTRSDVEDFLYREAAMLDNWQLMDWAALFTEDAEYLVPATDLPDGEPDTSLFLIYDDYHRLVERAKRLMKRTAHAEFPHSRLRRMIGNVMITSAEGNVCSAIANFVVFRSRLQQTDVFSGHSLYEFVVENEGIKIRKKRAVLNSDDLRTQRKLSIIL